MQKQEKRNAKIIALRERGLTYAAIGEKFDISLGRVRQIVIRQNIIQKQRSRRQKK